MRWLPLALGLWALPGWAAEGSVVGYAFRGGQAMSGVEIEADGQTATTERGRFSLVLPEGTHTLTVRAPGVAPARVEVTVVGDQVSELLITVTAAGVFTSVEAPPSAGATIRESVATGTISGVVTDEDTGEPVVDGRVFVRGLGVEGRTDEAGRFTLEVPVGEWQLSLLHSRYATQAVPGVPVAEGQASEVAATLVPAGLKMAGFTVTAPRIEGGTAELLDERRSSGAVAEMLGVEQMSKAGDTDAASALKRVTGLTLAGGKYIYVRGLGERYSATLMNGATLPSPEPERRVVPLDMFPTAVLESVVIQKTFTPDMPAEFGGGVIVLRTRRVPADPVFKVGIGAGYDAGTTLHDGLRGPVGPWDWLGVDGGFRALPEAVDRASAYSPLEEEDAFSDRGYSAAELEAFGEAMPNHWGFDRRTVAPDFSMNLTAGNGVKLGNTNLGALAAMTYKSGWDIDVYDRTYYLLGDGDQLEPGHSYTFEELNHEVVLGGILHLGAQVGDHQSVGLSTIVTRNTDDTSRLYEGFNRDLGGILQIGRWRWEERMLVANQAHGTHRLPEAMNLEWRYTNALAFRDEPDRRDWRIDQETEEIWLLSDRPEGNQIFYSALQDDHNDIGLDLTIGLGPHRFEEGAPILRVGGTVTTRTREVASRRYKYLHKGPNSRDEGVLARPVEEIFTPETIGPDGFQFEEITRPTDNYTATQQIFAGYAMGDVPVTSTTRVVAGARVEASDQYVKTFQLFNPNDVPVEANLATVDLLPALVVTQEITEDMLVRGGYGRTVSRPDFRELSEATFNDVTGGRQIYGNPELQRATIDNVDLRWEWYPDPGEALSVAGFYKRFTNPIESIVVVSAQHSVTFENAERANNVGVELDVRKHFDFVHRALSDVYFAGNAAWIRSDIVLGENSGIQTNDERPLQGQSPWVYNLQLGWDDPVRGHSAALVYHAFGPRIVEVGALGAPDTLELPVHQLDFIGGFDLGSGFSLKAKAANLLNPEIRYAIGRDTITESRKDGRGFSLGVSWSR